MSMSVSSWGAQNRTQHSKCGLGSGFLPLGRGQDHFALSAVSTPRAAQDAFGLLFSKGTLLDHVQLVHQDPQVFFCKTGTSIFVEMSRRSLAFIYLWRSMGFMVNKYVSIP